MSCPDPQNSMTYPNMQGQNMLTDIQGQNALTNVLAHNFVSATGTAAQSKPAQGGIAQGGIAQGGAAQAVGPYGTTGGAVSQQSAAPGTQLSQFSPITPTTEPPALNLNSLQFLNAALRTQIGRRVTIDFLIGTNTLTDRSGTLLAVGANYLIINPIETDDLLFCDFFTIKFVTVYG